MICTICTSANEFLMNGTALVMEVQTVCKITSLLYPCHFPFSSSTASNLICYNKLFPHGFKVLALKSWLLLCLAAFNYIPYYVLVFVQRDQKNNNIKANWEAN